MGRYCWAKTKKLVKTQYHLKRDACLNQQPVEVSPDWTF